MIESTEKNATCPACGGEGGHYADPTIHAYSDTACTVCDGSGRVTEEARFEWLEARFERIAEERIMASQWAAEPSEVRYSTDPFDWFE